MPARDYRDMTGCGLRRRGRGALGFSGKIAIHRSSSGDSRVFTPFAHEWAGPVIVIRSGGGESAVGVGDEWWTARVSRRGCLTGGGGVRVDGSRLGGGIAGSPSRAERVRAKVLSRGPGQDMQALLDRTRTVPEGDPLPCGGTGSISETPSSLESRRRGHSHAGRSAAGGPSPRMWAVDASVARRW